LTGKEFTLSSTTDDFALDVRVGEPTGPAHAAGPTQSPRTLATSHCAAQIHPAVPEDIWETPRIPNVAAAVLPISITEF
jgi:hypothetical protein